MGNTFCENLILKLRMREVFYENTTEIFENITEMYETSTVQEKEGDIGAVSYIVIVLLFYSTKFQSIVY
jgi:hypothetical protein